MYRCPAIIALTLAGCSSLPDAEQRIAHAAAKAAAAGFIAERVTAGPFELQAYHRGLDRGAHQWHVYLEGDGQAFLARTRLSPDPTPVDPIGLDLALTDPGPAVLYLGRPCQYRPADDAGPCPSSYWSSHRFADEVVGATLGAINTMLDEHGDGSTDLTLIGYSGGGVLAALAASRSPRVKRLITVAAPLDLSAWTDQHHVTPLSGSLDPTAIASRLTMPQWHLSGRQDNIVPPALQNAFIHSLPPATAVQVMTLEGFDHTCCWRRHWPSLLTTALDAR